MMCSDESIKNKIHVKGPGRAPKFFNKLIEKLCKLSINYQVAANRKRDRKGSPETNTA